MLHLLVGALRAELHNVIRCERHFLVLCRRSEQAVAVRCQKFEAAHVYATDYMVNSTLRPRRHLPGIDLLYAAWAH